MPIVEQLPLFLQGLTRQGLFFTVEAVTVVVVVVVVVNVATIFVVFVSLNIQFTQQD